MKNQAKNFSLPTTKLLDTQNPCDGPTNLSDHRSFSFTIAKHKIENGPGYWRFNNHLLENTEFIFGKTQRIRRTIRNYATENLPTEWNDQQISEAPSKLEPQHLMDMILCDARAYAIKFMATRKRFDNATKEKQQDDLDTAVQGQASSIFLKIYQNLSGDPTQKNVFIKMY